MEPLSSPVVATVATGRKWPVAEKPDNTRGPLEDAAHRPLATATHVGTVDFSEPRDGRTPGAGIDSWRAVSENEDAGRDS